MGGGVRGKCLDRYIVSLWLGAGELCNAPNACNDAANRDGHCGNSDQRRSTHIRPTDRAADPDTARQHAPGYPDAGAHPNPCAAYRYSHFHSGCQRYSRNCNTIYYPECRGDASHGDTQPIRDPISRADVVTLNTGFDVRNSVLERSNLR
jgi:hypothetical protein